MPTDHDAVGRLFARLTSELEDSCEVAVEGQNPRLPLDGRAVLALRLRGRICRAVLTIDKIDRAIVRLRGADQ